MSSYVRYDSDVRTLGFQIVNRMQFTTQQNCAKAITRGTKEAIIQSKESLCPAFNTTLRGMPRLGLIHLSEGSHKGAGSPAPIASLVIVSCEFERIENIAFRESYLANYVEKLQQRSTN